MRALPLLLASAMLLGAAAPAHHKGLVLRPRPDLAATPLSRAEPWWNARLKAKAQELAKGQYDLVWYGDSITANWELAGPEPWRNFAPVWDHYYGGRHALNLGFKGDATAHLLWRIENGEAAGIHPKAAVVLIGANNFGRVRWTAEQTDPAIARIVTELHQRLPGVKILLLGVLPSIRDAWVDANTETLNRALAKRYRGSRDTVFMDVSDLFMTKGKVDASKFLDGHLTPPDPPLHPSAQTQAAIAARIEPTLARMLGDTPRKAP